MNDVFVLDIRIGKNFPKDKWEADDLLAKEFEKMRMRFAAWRPEKPEGVK